MILGNWPVSLPRLLSLSILRLHVAGDSLLKNGTELIVHYARMIPLHNGRKLLVNFLPVDKSFESTQITSSATQTPSQEYEPRSLTIYPTKKVFWGSICLSWTL